MRPSYPLSRLDYVLPPELIAQHPLSNRSDSRMLHIDVAQQRFAEAQFRDLPGLLPAGTLAVFNNSRVIPARLYGSRRSARPGQGGGRVEVLYMRWQGGGVCEALVGSNAALGAGEAIALPDGWTCTLTEAKSLNAIAVLFTNAEGEPCSHAALHDYLSRHGLPPLPPYIKRKEHATGEQAAADASRYQTVYARQDGSVAAPTAGLHFDEALLGELERRGVQRREVTLHVGYGTFAPVRVDDLAAHPMHSEECSVDAAVCREYFAARAEGAPVLAVGTTSLRILHTLAGLDAAQRELACATGLQGATDAFIYPGHGTTACDLLLTNFHLPRSTLLALVYAVGGEELMRSAYQHAIEQRYRFYSYGDCMLIDRRGAR